MTEKLLLDRNSIFKVFQLMWKIGGGFERTLAAAWFIADLENQVIIEDAFNYLIIKFNREMRRQETSATAEKGVKDVN